MPLKPRSRICLVYTVPFKPITLFNNSHDASMSYVYNPFFLQSFILFFPVYLLFVEAPFSLKMQVSLLKETRISHYYKLQRWARYQSKLTTHYPENKWRPCDDESLCISNFHMSLRWPHGRNTPKEWRWWPGVAIYVKHLKTVFRIRR